MRMLGGRRVFCGAAVMAACCALAPFAWAQAVAGGAVAAGEGTGGEGTGEGSAWDGSVEELMVTARRRQETLVEIPVSVTALDEWRLRERGLTELNQVEKSARFR